MRETALLSIPFNFIACIRSSTLRVETPFHVRLLHHGQQGPFCMPAGFQEAWKIAPASQLGNTQIDLANARSPQPLPVSIPVVHLGWHSFMPLCTIKLLGFQLHKHLTHHSFTLCQKNAGKYRRITSLQYTLSWEFAHYYAKNNTFALHIQTQCIINFVQLHCHLLIFARCQGQASTVTLRLWKLRTAKTKKNVLIPIMSEHLLL